MLEAQQLTWRYDERSLFQALSLHISPGEIMQISGGNGAGKSTLLRLLCGLAQPDEGTILWHGQALPEVRDAFHRQLLWLGHQPGVKRALSAHENLRFFHPASSSVERENALAATGLAGYEDVPLARLSAGQQRRVALARLWLTDATLWILDEPLTALDSNGIETLTSQLEQHALRGRSVILTTHQPLRPLLCPVRMLPLTGPEDRL